MKKVLMVFASCVMVAVLVVCVGCDPSTPEYKKIMAKDETDGHFYYYYDKKYLKGYAIVGDMGENNPEIMYLPAYYKGKEVKQVFYTAAISSFGMRQETFGPSFKNVKKIYIPYTHPAYAYCIDSSKCSIQEVYYPGTTFTKSDGLEDGSMDLWRYFVGFNTYKYVTIFYFYSDFYEIVLEECIKNIEENPDFAYEKGLDEIFFSYGNKRFCYAKCNVVFYFNYKDSSNDNVFFVDHLDYGGTIKSAPYSPIRVGYEFTGWFKEAECVNKWKFDTDTLPTVDIDENGNVTEFIETKLYAGWRKI